MELGFGDLIDKFEEYFGRFWTRVVLLLSGVTFSVGCMRLVWDWAIKPLVSLLPSAKAVIAPVESLWMGLAFAIGAGIGTALMAAFLNWRLSKRLDLLENRLREVGDMAEMAILAPPPSPF